MEEEKKSSDLKELLLFIVRWALLFLVMELSPLNPWFILGCYVYLSIEIAIIEVEDEESLE